MCNYRVLMCLCNIEQIRRCVSHLWHSMWLRWLIILSLSIPLTFYLLQMYVNHHVYVQVMFRQILVTILQMPVFLFDWLVTSLFDYPSYLFEA